MTEKTMTFTSLWAKKGISSSWLRIWGAAIIWLAFPAMAAKPVTLGIVEQVTTAPVSWYSGTVHSPQQAKLSMEATGRLITVADFGQVVKKGDVLAKVDAEALVLQLKIEQLKLKKAKAYVEHYAVELNRLEQLGRNMNVSETDRDKASHELAVRRYELENARLQVSLLKDQLARTTLRAPFDGTVNTVYLREGEYVSRGEAMLHLVNTRQQEIRLQAPISIAAKLERNSSFVITAGALEFEATLSTVGASADVKSRLLELRLLPQGQTLVIGQPVRVAIPERYTVEGVMVPHDAIVTNAQGKVMFVVNRDESEQARVKAIPVEILYGVDGHVVVKADVAIGKEIVIRGATGLSDGQKVEVTATRS
ncbi:efflux RND transporter periplasmic adaptor subunit [Photobacterium aquae]|nr:efflux RND transporter periplasmic adaptor subunit [Photobacterium aquae]